MILVKISIAKIALTKTPLERYGSLHYIPLNSHFSKIQSGTRYCAFSTWIKKAPTDQSSAQG
jgi:hypothetical protein